MAILKVKLADGTFVEIPSIVGRPGDDGVGIQSIEQTKTSTEDGGENVFTVTLTDGSKTSFSVYNGGKGNKGDQGEPGVVDYGVVTNAVRTHNTNTEAHNDIRLLIEGLTSRLNALADSDDETLDQMAEVVAYIKDNRDLISQITTDKVNVADIVNDLVTNVANKPLSAAQGVALKALIDEITVPTKVSQLENDKQYLTSYTETDPNVPAWAKAASKPSYTAAEVGALPITGGDLSGKISLPQGTGLDLYGSYGDGKVAANGIRSNYSNQLILGALNAWESIVTYQGIRPATDANGAINLGESTRLWKNLYLSGVLSDGTNSISVANIANKDDIPDVPDWAMAENKPSYSAEDVGALPNTTTIPTKTSQLTNDSGFMTSAPVSSVNGKTGAVQLGASDVGARPNTWTPSAEDVGAAKVASPNNMLHNSNEFTFVPAGYEGVVHINDKTADGSQGNVTTYYFRDGKGGLSEVVVRSLQASAISVTGSFKAGTYKTDESEAALRISDNNEFNFGAQGNTLYIGYENRIGSSGYVNTYCFGRHTGGNDSEKGTIRCGQVVEGGTALSDKYVAKGQTETWTFTLEDGTEVTKAVYIG